MKRKIVELIENKKGRYMAEELAEEILALRYAIAREVLMEYTREDGSYMTDFFDWLEQQEERTEGNEKTT